MGTGGGHKGENGGLLGRGGEEGLGEDKGDSREGQTSS